MDFEEYEREGRVVYATFAAAVSKILTAAIGADKNYRLQQIKTRAKSPASLRQKIEERGILDTTKLERKIKDLAGCRVIFYTNNDVIYLIESRIIERNFEVLDGKWHYPKQVVKDVAGLYISYHFLVTLRPERIALPEYADFAGMRCEIQIQTILNHAWAEMAHGIIYKAPELGDFGSRELGRIETRMEKVARQYLLPAGHEFQKIASIFQRLIENKPLFDGDPLEAIVEAADNNVRAEALETFVENVLPFYDDPKSVYSEIVERLIVVADRARTTLPVEIKTPHGALPGKTYRDIVEAITGILTQHCYLDVDTTFDALRTLYHWASDEDEQKPLLELGKKLAQNQLEVWRQHGPAVQAILVKRIGMLGDDERLAMEPLLSAMLGKMLGADISSASSSSSAVTFCTGAVTASDLLRTVRTKAINLLKHQFTLAESDEGRRRILLDLDAATRGPYRGVYSNELVRIVMDDTRTILEFQKEIASTLRPELLQTIENLVLHSYWRHENLPETMRDDSDLVATSEQVQDMALAFRDTVNANQEFVIYKTLVGVGSVFLPAWKNKDFHKQTEQIEAYQTEQVKVLLTSVKEATADVWFDRISRYAQTKSDDTLTFSVFDKFLGRLAETQPAIVLSYIDRLDEPLTNFLPDMLAGLMRSAERAQALARVESWLDAGENISHIAGYLRFAYPFDETLLHRVLSSAIEHVDERAVGDALIATTSQFDIDPGTLVEEIFLPALRYLKAVRNFSWLRMSKISWLKRSIIQALDEKQAKDVLDALVSYPELEGNAEYIVAAIAERWPQIVVDFLGDRHAFARTDDATPRYDALPFTVNQLQAPLAAVPGILLEGARNWFDDSPGYLSYHGSRLLITVFPDLSNGLEEQLAALIAGGNTQDQEFVLEVLSEFKGKPCIYELMRAIVATHEPDSIMLSEIEYVLFKMERVSGDFGYAELYARRKKLLESWLADTNETVREFAIEQIEALDQKIVAENQSAEESITLRKLHYGENLDTDEEVDNGEEADADEEVDTDEEEK